MPWMIFWNSTKETRKRKLRLYRNIKANTLGTLSRSFVNIFFRISYEWKVKGGPTRIYWKYLHLIPMLRYRKHFDCWNKLIRLKRTETWFFITKYSTIWLRDSCSRILSTSPKMQINFTKRFLRIWKRL